jgi:lambda family phage portal protein
MGKYTNRKMNVSLNTIDRVVGFFSPKALSERIKHRAFIGQLSNQGFITSDSHKRSMRGWNPTANSADSDTIPKLNSARASSRDLYMSNPIATGALKRINTNVVGSGLNLQCRVDREFLGLSDEDADRWERQTEREFRSWAESVECDASRSLMFHDLQNLVFFSTILSGDCFALLPSFERGFTNYDLRVKVVEADYVSNPQLRFDTNKIAGGIEVDDNGAPIRYYFRKPGINTFLQAGASISDKWIPVDAFGPSGRRNVIHTFTKERPGQRRGMPLLAPVFEELKQLTRLSKAELDASLINAFFTVFVKHTTPDVSLADGFLPPTSGAYPDQIADEDTTGNPADEKVYEMGSGNIVDMDEDEEVQIADPKRPNKDFEAFFNAIVRQVGTAIEVPYEVLMQHFTSSYSASRGALQELWKYTRSKRTWIERYFCKPVYFEWLVEAILRGRVVAPGFLDDPLIAQAWAGSHWVGPGQGLLDPLKEAKASRMLIEDTLTTREDEYNRIHGQGNWDSVVDRKARENTKLADKGLTGIQEEQSAGADQIADAIEERGD